MNNPFVYGEVVPRAAFVDREVELDRLSADLAVGQKVFLISPRRYGKSSLDPAGARDARPARCADGRGHRQQLQLLRRVPRGLRAGAGGGRDAVGARAAGCPTAIGVPAGAAVRARRRRSRPDARWRFRAVRTERDVTASPTRCSRCRPLRRARRRRSSSRSTSSRRIDGVQRRQRRARAARGRAAPAPGRLRVRRLRAEPDGADDRPSRPFYKAGPVMRLEKIPADSSRRSSSRASPGPASARSRARRRDRRPRRQPAVRRAAPRARNLGRRARRRRQRAADLDHLHATLRRLLAEQDTIFEAIWQRLTLAQRAVLRAVVLAGRTRAAVGRRPRAPPPGRRLERAGVARGARPRRHPRAEGARYVVVDSLMREWVARRTF